MVGATAVSLLCATTTVITLSAPAAGASGLNTTGPPCATPPPVTTAEADSTVGITSNSVTVGNISILSGPVPGLFQGAPYGVEAYFDYINSKGGVNGRQLKVDSYDDAFSGQSNESETTTAVGKDFALVGNFSLFDSYGCKVLAANPAVADVSVTLDPGTNALPTDFSAQPLSQGAPEGPYIYLKKKYPKAIKSVGNLVSNTATAIANWQGKEAVMEHLGYHISYVRDISPVETDFTTDVINMRNDHVQFVYLTDLDWQVAAGLVQAMNQQNFHPQVLFSAGPAYADQYIAAAGGPSATNGLWLGQGTSLYLGEDAKVIPAVSTFLTWVKKDHPGFTPDLYTLYGWASAQLFVQALQAAGKNPTRGELLSQLQKITSFSASNLIGSSNPAKKLPPNCYIMAKIVNGKYQRVDDPPNGGYRCDAPYYSINGTLPEVNPSS